MSNRVNISPMEQSSQAFKLYQQGEFGEYAKFVNQLPEWLQVTIARDIKYWKQQGGLPKLVFVPKHANEQPTTEVE